MRWARWLDELWERPRKSRRRDARACWLLTRRLEVESLETRTQLTTLAYSATDIPLQIPPGNPNGTGTTISTIHVSDELLVRDVNVQLNIEHTWDSDLIVVLIAPDGTQAELFSRVGGQGDNFNGTFLDQQASVPIVGASAPFVGMFRPSGDLSRLRGRGRITPCF